MKKVIIGTILTIMVVLIIFMGTIWSHRNTMVELEERIEAQYTSNKSSYDNMWKKFKEMTQVTDMQADKMKELYQGLIDGRNKDTNLLFKMIKEDNPKLDQTTFTNLQNEIASSRNAFNNNQKQIADIVREYNTYAKKKFITANLLGYKTKDSNNYITTSDRTKDVFENKKDNEINLRK